VRKELKQLLEHEVWTPVHANTATSSTPLPSQLFLRDKRDSSGALVKVKARFVAGGHRQIRDKENHASPTVANEALLTTVAIAASLSHNVASIDVEAAYLEVDIDREQFLRIDTDVASHLVEIDPRYQPYRRENGSIVVKLRKALYGTLQATKLWYLRLSEVLTNGGFEENQYDACVFHKRDGPRLTLVATHVDDLLVTSSTAEGVSAVERLLLSAFKNLNTQRGPLIDHLGMRLELTHNGIRQVSSRSVSTSATTTRSGKPTPHPQPSPFLKTMNRPRLIRRGPSISTP
jgi:hypothetical protein